jgi:hypothetical protein
MFGYLRPGGVKGCRRRPPRKAFCFSTASFEALRVGCYDTASGGYFRRHRDIKSPEGHAMEEPPVNLHSLQVLGQILVHLEHGHLLLAEHLLQLGVRQDLAGHWPRPTRQPGITGSKAWPARARSGSRATGSATAEARN